MATPSTPDITCQKCGTTVPWGPYCPHCQAYLEFAGIPAWSPDVPEVEEPEAEDVPDQNADASEPAAPEAEQSPTIADVGAELNSAIDGVVDAAVAQVVTDSVVANESEPVVTSLLDVAPVAAPIAVPVPESTPEPTPKPESGSSKWRRGIRVLRPRQVIGYLAAVLVAVLLTLLFRMLGAGDLAWYVAPFFIVWGLLGIAMFGTIPDVEHADAVAAEEARLAAEEAARQAAEVAAAWDAAYAEEAARQHTEQGAAESEVFRELVGEDSVDRDAMGARPPQPVERTATVAKTKASGREAERDIACLSCGRLNLPKHLLCEYCGASMEGAVVKPAVVPVMEARLLTDDDDKEAKKKREKKMSRSWRGPIAVVTVVAVVAGAFLFAFFGPGALSLRFSSGRLYQTIARWINPYIGEVASVASVTASSNLPGADATEVGFGDARTFWASAPEEGYGVGSTITYTMSTPTEIDRMVIFPGIQSGQFDIRALATPREVTLTFDGGTSTSAQLAEIESTQQQRQLVPFSPVKTCTVTLVIDSIYPPRGQAATGVGSVAISGTQFLESPPAPTFFNLQNGPIGARMPGGTDSANLKAAPKPTATCDAATASTSTATSTAPTSTSSSSATTN